MPIYEYRCKHCQHQLEVLQKISDQPLTECPSCHQAGLEKLISAAGFQLKGSGWYATDYKAKPMTANDKEGSTSSTTDSSATTKTSDDKSSAKS